MSAEIAMHKRGYILPVEDRSTHAKRILLVDDDVDILGVAAEMLETLGYDVIAARTGLEALALLRDNSSISISVYRYPNARHGRRGACGNSSGLTARSASDLCIRLRTTKYGRSVSQKALQSRRLG